MLDPDAVLRACGGVVVRRRGLAPGARGPRVDQQDIVDPQLDAVVAAEFERVRACLGEQELAGVARRPVLMVVGRGNARGAVAPPIHHKPAAWVAHACGMGNRWTRKVLVAPVRGGQPLHVLVIGRRLGWNRLAARPVGHQPGVATGRRGTVCGHGPAVGVVDGCRLARRRIAAHRICRRRPSGGDGPIAGVPLLRGRPARRVGDTGDAGAPVELDLGGEGGRVGHLADVGASLSGEIFIRVHDRRFGGNV